VEEEEPTGMAVGGGVTMDRETSKAVDTYLSSEEEIERLRRALMTRIRVYRVDGLVSPYFDRMIRPYLNNKLCKNPESNIYQQPPQRTSRIQSRYYGLFTH
jgi:hypothetical protein